MSLSYLPDLERILRCKDITVSANVVGADPTAPIRYEWRYNTSYSSNAERLEHVNLLNDIFLAANQSTSGQFVIPAGKTQLFLNGTTIMISVRVISGVFNASA